MHAHPSATRLGVRVALLVPLLVGACREPPPPHTVIPNPRAVALDPGDSAVVTRITRIEADPDAPVLRPVADHLEELLGYWVERNPPAAASGDAIATGSASPSDPPDSVAADIRLTLDGADPSLGSEGYRLEVRGDGITIRATTAAGVFYGVQTLRQLLPAEVEYTAAYRRPWVVPAIEIRDAPSFSWRGAMLDVARHFRSVEEVKRFIDLMVPYKLNRLHLHLSDDQGWRLDIPGWPDLARIGGSTEVGGGPGGYYSMEEYAELVAYAAERFITVVPEIDVPGHTNAALASYAELNCDDVAREPYTGVAVGFSALCVERDVTWRFLDEVVREIAARTPGPWFHIGGDEVETLSEEAYADFVARMAGIVRSYGKRMVGWDEIALADVGEGATIQLWRPAWAADDPPAGDGAVRLRESVTRAAGAGAELILSPADRVYLDMKYDASTALGLRWAALIDERRAYDWSVEAVFGQIPEEAILGVEAPLWSETLGTLDDVEYLAFPRLAAVAEIGWSPADRRDWPDFRRRLAAQGPRWSALGVNFRRSPDIPWPPEP
jgi:hexosaminidase